MSTLDLKAAPEGVRRDAEGGISRKTARAGSIALLLALFLAIYGATLWTPALLDDADATHAEAALHIARSGDWVTLKVDGLRYLEKAARTSLLDGWRSTTALLCIRDGSSFHEDMAAFAGHLPATLAVFLLAALGYWWALLAWGGHEYGERAAFYSGMGLLTAAGVFLFTRVFIPEALLSLFLCAALFCFLRGLELRRPLYFYGAAVLIALAVLTKGLISSRYFSCRPQAFAFCWQRENLHQAGESCGSSAVP